MYVGYNPASWTQQSVQVPPPPPADLRALAEYDQARVNTVHMAQDGSLWCERCGARGRNWGDRKCPVCEIRGS